MYVYYIPLLERVDATNFDCRTWPRAGAVGARLWGLGNVYQQQSFYPSLSTCSARISALKPSSHSNGSNSDNGNIQRSAPRNYDTDNILTLNYLQTKYLYISYIRYRYYLLESLQMNVANIIYHYPLNCKTVYTNNNANSNDNDHINDDNILGKSYYPSTMLKKSYCQSTNYKNNRYHDGEIYSEEMLSELLAYR